MRNIPVELVTRYEEAGWWIRETLGEVPARGLKPDHALPTVDDVREHFAGHGVARQKWPAILFEVADYPRTASGKVQKRLVRDGLGKTLR
jgi:non-ribosomal peptide synthetase component E (peptide arylation enzyme)